MKNQEDPKEGVLCLDRGDTHIEFNQGELFRGKKKTNTLGITIKTRALNIVS